MTAKVNLADSTETTNDSTNLNNDNHKNNNDEIAPVAIIIKEENERKEPINNNKKKGKRKMEDINERESDDSDNLKNIDENVNDQIEEVVDFFSGDVIIYQLLQAANLFFRLNSQTVLSLTLTSKTLFKPLSSLISQHFTFHHKHTPLIHYHPKRLKIHFFDIDGLFENNPNLSNVTEIEFTANNNYPFGLTTDYPFDYAITNLLSFNITHLTIGINFDQPINSLFRLTKLTHLEFHYNSMFNHPIDNLLPPYLTKLSMGEDFNQHINHLPPKSHI